MKTKKKKEFDAVKFMRKQRDRISKEIAPLTKQQIVERFRTRIPKQRIRPSA